MSTSACGDLFEDEFDQQSLELRAEDEVGREGVEVGVGEGTSEIIVTRDDMQDPHFSWEGIGISLETRRGIRVSCCSGEDTRGGHLITILIIHRVPFLTLWLD